MLSKNCIYCGALFYKPSNESRNNWDTRHKYCCRKCKTDSSKGRESKNKGKKFPQFSGDKHYCWKGDNVGYFALHEWVVKNLGKPSRCEKCSRTDFPTSKMQWANKSGLYKRDLSDWVRLCVWCHGKADKTFFKKGKVPWNKGKKGIYSEETRKKMGLANKGKVPWNKK